MGRQQGRRDDGKAKAVGVWRGMLLAAIVGATALAAMPRAEAPSRIDPVYPRGGSDLMGSF